METYSPLVSIVIPVYNGANYMREAIDSAIAQTYKNIEIIVVNDGSTDNGETERIALSYGDKIKYYKKENGGCASALNYGISKMNGEWFSWLSHDDGYFPEKIQSAIDCINQNDFMDEKTIISCSSCIIDAAGKKLSSRISTDGYVPAEKMFESFMGGKSLNGCALMIPKSALDKVGCFSTKYIYILDWIYWMELAINGYAFYKYKNVLVKNRRHREQVSVKKHDLLKKETREYIADLIDRVADDNEKLYNIWLYCLQVRFKAGAKSIERLVKIPIGIRIRGFCRVLHHYAVTMAKKIVSIIRRCFSERR